MNKKITKKLPLIITILVLLLTTIVIADTGFKTIQVKFRSINLIVDGEKSNDETLLYNDTTYVSLRSAANMLGADVDWNNSTNTAKITTKLNDPSKPIEEKPIEIPSNNPKDITINDLILDTVVKDPDSIGTVYMEATYKNNTDFPIASYQVTYLDKYINKKRYLSSYDTVLPGEKSPIFDTFGPESGDMKDMEKLETRISIYINENDKGYITYNHKLQTYKYTGIN